MLVKLIKTSQNLSSEVQIKDFKWMSYVVEVVSVEENLDFLHKLFLHLHLFKAYITLRFYTLMDISTPSFI
jgi:hypothetical protein